MEVVIKKMTKTLTLNYDQLKAIKYARFIVGQHKRRPDSIKTKALDKAYETLTEVVEMIEDDNT